MPAGAGAHHHAGLRQTIVGRGGGRDGDAEVGDERGALVQQNVLRLHIAVDEPARVCMLERGHDLRRYADRVIHRELPLAVESLPSDSPSMR